MKSLHGFAKEHNLAKATVHRKAKELKIDTSKGLTLEDCDRLLDAFGISTIESVEAELMEDSYTTPETSALTFRQVELLPKDEKLAITRYQPQVNSFNTDELNERFDLTKQTLNSNLDNFEQATIAKYAQLGKRIGTQAKIAMADEIAKEVNSVISQ